MAKQRLPGGNCGDSAMRFPERQLRPSKPKKRSTVVVLGGHVLATANLGEARWLWTLLQHFFCRPLGHAFDAVERILIQLFYGRRAILIAQVCMMRSHCRSLLHPARDDTRCSISQSTRPVHDSFPEDRSSGHTGTNLEIHANSGRYWTRTPSPTCRPRCSMQKDGHLLCTKPGPYTGGKEVGRERPIVDRVDFPKSYSLIRSV